MGTACMGERCLSQNPAAPYADLMAGIWLGTAAIAIGVASILTRRAWESGIRDGSYRADTTMSLGETRYWRLPREELLSEIAPFVPARE